MPNAFITNFLTSIWEEDAEEFLEEFNYREPLGLFLVNEEIDAFEAAFEEKFHMQFPKEKTYAEISTDEGCFKVHYRRPNIVDDRAFCSMTNDDAESYLGKDHIEDKCLLIEAQHQPIDEDLYTGGDCYDDEIQLISEFRARLKGLLPDGFPFEDRIGYLDYFGLDLYHAPIDNDFISIIEDYIYEYYANDEAYSGKV